MQADSPGNLETEGPPGLETIIVMVRKEPLATKLLGSLPRLLRVLDTRGWQSRVKAPVMWRLIPNTRMASEAASTRTPVITKVGGEIQNFQKTLASRVADMFDEVVVCTFANLGPRRRYR